MADNYLNNTGLAYYHNRILTLFPSKTDFDALDDKVDDIIAEGGEPNVIETVKVNGTALTPDANKAVDVTVPTNTSDLSNDSGFITASANNLANYYLSTQTYTKAEVDNLIGSITGVEFEIVQSLPQSGEAGTIYLVPNSGSAPNIYDEYIWANNTFEKIGTTDVDLSQYWAKADLVAMTTAEIDALFA